MTLVPAHPSPGDDATAPVPLRTTCPACSPPRSATFLPSSMPADRRKSMSAGSKNIRVRIPGPGSARPEGPARLVRGESSVSAPRTSPDGRRATAIPPCGSIQMFLRSLSWLYF
ncbi:hypothetical protein PHLGIDRAFT_200974 [Phlebiopsis gigantea 11061_1 CR5-6]|uniref:Uncharacterized protein n=1 Tax=Phlebiopsis gigantea (strain 11061_1 CR5-6) TaxID=745531 RepID=A0A0C3PFG1_PHLG1|nr:hypothetical protein PHLGIDRAFT_200974 [Phlebiopsis gigantea 11061_1 CR5-6]